MRFLRIIWDDGADGNVGHIDEHDLTPADVEYVLAHATDEETSNSSDRPCVFGYTPDDELDGATLVPGSGTSNFNFLLPRLDLCKAERQN